MRDHYQHTKQVISIRQLIFGGAPFKMQMEQSRHQLKSEVSLQKLVLTLITLLSPLANLEYQPPGCLQVSSMPVTPRHLYMTAHGLNIRTESIRPPTNGQALFTS